MSRFINGLVVLGLLGLVATIAISAIPGLTYSTLMSGGPAPLFEFTVLGTPAWLFVVAGIMLAAAVWLGDKLKLAAFVAVTILLFYVIYTYREGLLEVGHTRPLLYLIAIATAVLMTKALVGAPARESFTASMLVLAVFIILGISHIWGWNKTSSMASTAQGIVEAGCDSKRKVIAITGTLQLLPRGCNMFPTVIEGAGFYSVYRDGTSQLVRPGEEKKYAGLPTDWIKAAGSIAKLSVVFCPGLTVWDEGKKVCA